MDIFVITPPDGTRNRRLFDDLSRLDGHRPVRIDAVMLSTFPADVDHRRIRALNGRALRPGELGCSASHHEARRRVAAAGDRWACVLEDDAFISDIDSFGSLLTEIEAMESPPNGAVISLFAPVATVDRQPYGPGGRLRRCLFEPPFAVAYCISAEGARRLVAVDDPPTFIADWPRGSRVDFFTTPDRVVAHGDDSVSSLIGSGRPIDSADRAVRWGNLDRRVIIKRLRQYLFIDYVRDRRYFTGPADYYRSLLRHRIWHHIGRFAGRPVEGFPARVRRPRWSFGWPRS